MSNLLVTGGAGFIGANFVRHWRERHSDDGLVVLDADAGRVRIDGGGLHQWAAEKSKGTP